MPVHTYIWYGFIIELKQIYIYVRFWFKCKQVKEYWLNYLKSFSYIFRYADDCVKLVTSPQFLTINNSQPEDYPTLQSAVPTTV